MRYAFVQNIEKIIEQRGEEYLIQGEVEIEPERGGRFMQKGVFCIVNENPVRYGYSSIMKIRGTGSYLLQGDEALDYWRKKK
jgi:hypothetical protein